MVRIKIANLTIFLCNLPAATTHVRFRRFQVGGEPFNWSVSRSFNILHQEIEAILHCIMSIQEAIPLEDNLFLAQMFGSDSDALGRFPAAGQDRIRRTMLGLIGRNTET
jgi:hypothetical protein